MQRIELRPAKREELDALYQLITNDEKWTQFNGPYFGYQRPSPEAFAEGLFQRLVQGEEAQLITCDGQPIGSVSYYWECEQTRWLEMGILIYDSSLWGRGVASRALPLWISDLFARYDIARVGLTTWSGNPAMMVCAEKIGMKLEARLRKVRYYQGQYYDSVKYGLLREEWPVTDSPSTDLQNTDSPIFTSRNIEH